LQFLGSLKDNLNAEVALGTVTNVREACAWLGYTYLFIRMKTNPLVYGITWEEVMFSSIVHTLDVKQYNMHFSVKGILSIVCYLIFTEQNN
jgi:replicative superfamily II helicase